MNKNLRALADAQKARRLAQQNKSHQPDKVGERSENLPKPAAPAAADTATAVRVFPSLARVVDAGGLISESVAIKMQQDAAGVPPALYPTKGTEKMENENVESRANDAEVVVADAFNPTSFNHIYVNVALTLNLGDPRMSDTKANLSAVNIKGVDYNLYSPFRKAGKPGSDDGACPGIVRAMLDRALDLTDTVNNSRIVFLGDKAVVGETLATSIESTRRSVEGMLPSKPGHVLFDVTDEEAVVDRIRISDVVSVRSWINSPKEPQQIVANNAILNFVVNAGALYDAPDKLKYITQVQTVLNLVTKTRGDAASTNIVLALALPAMMLTSSSIRDLVGDLIDEHQFVLYSRMELENLDDGESGFLPQCIDDVNKLLPPQCDILLMKLLGDDAKSEPEGA